MINYKSPKCYEEAFNCPYCNAYSNMKWYKLYYLHTGYNYLDNYMVSRCSCCDEMMIWRGEEMIYPLIIAAPMPHVDMPQNIKDIYLEAREIASKSPKGASALLRLALQMLCNHLVGGNKNINDMIAELVRNGLPQTLQQAFDIVRVVGNNAVHPGTISFDDNPDMVYKLFELLNLIVEYMIAKPKEILAFYNNTVPENLKQAIVQRDTNP